MLLDIYGAAETYTYTSRRVRVRVRVRVRARDVNKTTIPSPGRSIYEDV